LCCLEIAVRSEIPQYHTVTSNLLFKVFRQE